MRHWSDHLPLATLQLPSTGAAVSQARSMNTYLDSTARLRLNLTQGSVVPLWRAWERIVDVFAAQSVPYLAPAVTLLQERIAALNALTKSALAALLEATWGEPLNPDDFTKNALVMKVLAYEGLWVDLGYGQA